MSLLRDTDVLGVRVARTINGKRHIERVGIRALDLIYLSTPELLRAFSRCVDTAVARLDAIEEYSGNPNGAEQASPGQRPGLDGQREPSAESAQRSFAAGARDGMAEIMAAKEREGNAA